MQIAMPDVEVTIFKHSIFCPMSCESNLVYLVGTVMGAMRLYTVPSFTCTEQQAILNNSSKNGSISEDVQLDEAQLLFKSQVWQHFGFQRTEDERDQIIVNKTKAVCKYCKTAFLPSPPPQLSSHNLSQ